MSEPKRRGRKAASQQPESFEVPQSLEAEQSCLGAMMMQGQPEIQRDIVSAALCMVGSEHFYREHHKHIYDAIVSLYTQAEPVDVVTVSEVLRNQGLLEKCGNGEYLLSLLEACPNASIKSVEHYARIVLTKYDARQRIATLEETLRQARTGETSEAASEAMRRLADIERQSQLARMGAKTKGGISASDLLRKKLPKTRMVIEGLLPIGLTILAGNPKAGKSWMSFGIAIGVVTGSEVLGRRVEQGEALYLALEDTEQRLQDRLLHLWKGSDSALSKLELHTEWPRLDEGGGEKLDAWLAIHPDCKLVIIDTLQKIRPAVRGGGGDFYGEDYLAVGELKRIADQRGVALLLIHHTRKGSGMIGGDALEEVAGTMGITGAADGIVVLRRTRGGGEGTLFVTGRDVNEQELAVQWDGTTGIWSAMGEAGEVQMSSARKAIWQTLFEFHQQGQITATANDIAGASGRSDMGNIRQTLHQMCKDGQIRRLDRGEYALLEEDKSRAMNTPIVAQNNVQNSPNNANNANKSENIGSIKPNSAPNVSDVRAANNAIDENDSDEFLASVATLCGLTIAQARFVRDDYRLRFGRLDLSTVAFRLHYQRMFSDGTLPTSEAAQQQFGE